MRSQQPRQKVLIVTEVSDQQTLELANQVVQRLKMSQLFQLYSESSKDLQGTIQIQCNAGNRLKLDYIFSVGENRTLLRSLRYNKDFSNSPLISISNGHEPIMSSYTYCDLQEVLTKFIRLAPKRQLKVGNIMKMQVFEHSKTHTKKFLTNYSSDLEIHRNMECSVLKLDVYLRTEGKEYIKLTSLWGDGLIISTPFGSMSRSMFQNGPIFNQNIECIQIVAICPLSLTFRPIVLPKESEILIRVSDDSRSTGQVFADGEYIRKITTGEGIKIRKDNQSTHIIKGLGSVSDQVAWIFKLQQVLSWGEQYHPQPQKKAQNKKLELTVVQEEDLKGKS